jgi:hypothetical protein
MIWQQFRSECGISEGAIPASEKRDCRKPQNTKSE